MSDIKALDQDIPTETAWQKGRRLYVRCGYGSQLNNDLRNLGAHWDGVTRALWIGSTKKAAVIEVVQASLGRKKAIQDIKSAGRWVHIPYEAHEIRARAKALAGVYGGDDQKGWWAMREDAHLTEITGLVKAWQEKADQARKAQEAARVDQAAKAEAEAVEADRQAAQARRQRLLERSGRTPTGETAELREISTRRMNKATAHDMASSIGDLVRLADGRRGIITGVEIWFTNDEMASSVCWHAETHDEAHWDFKYTLAVVEPTEDEQTQDATGAAEAKDAAELNALIDEAGTLTAPLAQDWTHVPDEEREGEITVQRGSTHFEAGTLILTRDGRVVWQHPGYYDDYIPTQGVSSDPDTVERVRRIIAAGSRTRVYPGMQDVWLAVHAREETSA